MPQNIVVFAPIEPQFCQTFFASMRMSVPLEIEATSSVPDALILALHSSFLVSVVEFLSYEDRLPAHARHSLCRWRCASPPLGGRPRFPVRTSTLSIKTGTCSRSLPFAAVVVADKGMPSRSTSQCIRVPFPLSLWFT